MPHYPLAGIGAKSVRAKDFPAFGSEARPLQRVCPNAAGIPLEEEAESAVPDRPPVRREGVLRARLIVAFLVLSLVPLFGSNTVGFLRSKEILEGLVERYLVGIVGLQATHIQGRLEQRGLYLEAITSGNRFLQAALEVGRSGALVMGDAATPEAVSDYLARKLSESERFTALVLYDGEGGVYASAGANAGFDGTVGLGGRQPVLIPTGPETPPVLRFSAEVRGGDGDVIGVLAAIVPLDAASEFLDIPQHVAGAIESFILDERGYPVFVSHPHGHLQYDQRFDSPLVFGPNGVSRRYNDREGVPVLGVSAELPEYGWRFLAEVPVADALQELRGLRVLSWILGGAFFFLVLVAAWVVASGIVAPVQRLVGAVRNLGEGDLNVRVPPGGGDEIAELGEAFNEMAADLAANQNRIEHLHRTEIERAEQLATVGEVAAGVAHEIKNPVVGISNGLDLVLRHVKDHEELAPITTEMKRQLTRIEQAVRDLLAYARPPEASFGAVHVNEVVRRALVLVEPRSQKNSVTLDVKLGEDLPEIIADAELLVQAVVNLLINAVQFSPDGSSVIVETGTTGTDLFVRVTDSGPGIPDEVRADLFRPFFTTRHAGTGLGLPITRGIAERHAGRIDVSSVLGEGSSFTLILPVGGRVEGRVPE